MITARPRWRPGGTCTGLPLTEMEIQSLLNRFSDRRLGTATAARSEPMIPINYAYNFVYHTLHGEETCLSAVSDLSNSIEKLDGIDVAIG